VQGNVDCVKQGLTLLMRRFVFGNDDDEDEETAVGSGNTTTSSSSSTNNHQLRILIPSAACGMLIGRSGQHIKSISVSSGTRINLGQKSDTASINTAERIFSIFGGQENIRKCVYLVLECMEKEIKQAARGQQEESVWRYINMSTSYYKTMNNYSHNNNNNNSHRGGGNGDGSVATTTGGFGGQVIVPRDSLVEKVLTDHPTTTTLIQGSGLLNPQSACSTATATTTTASQQQQQQQVIGGQLSPSVLQVLAGARELGGILSTTSSTTTSTSTTPSSDNVLGAPLGNNNTTQLSGTIDYTSLPSSSASAFSVAQAAARVQQQPSQPLYKLEETAAPTTNASTYGITLAVPDSLVGAVIGQSGSTLTQLQLCSQTRIRISRRGEFVTGTNKRIVKITGNTKENCDAAQFWIAQRILMAQEETESGGNGGGRGGRGRGTRQGRGSGGGRGRGGRTQTKEKKLTVAADRNNE